jgi:hypothetical protein
MFRVEIIQKLHTIVNPTKRPIAQRLHLLMYILWIQALGSRISSRTRVVSCLFHAGSFQFILNAQREGVLFAHIFAMAVEYAGHSCIQPINRDDGG